LWGLYNIADGSLFKNMECKENITKVVKVILTITAASKVAATALLEPLNV
jgi:hypothetical protein